MRQQKNVKSLLLDVPALGMEGSVDNEAKGGHIVRTISVSYFRGKGTVISVF